MAYHGSSVPPTANDDSSVHVLSRSLAISNGTGDGTQREPGKSLTATLESNVKNTLLLDLFRVLFYHNIGILQLPIGFQWKIKRELGNGVTFQVDEARLPISELLFEDLEPARTYLRDGDFVDHTEKTWPLDTKVAFKTAHVKIGGYEAKFRELIRELRVLGHGPLQGHPNLVHLLAVTWNVEQIMSGDYNESLGYPVIVTELATEGSLLSFLVNRDRQHSLTQKEKASLGADVANGLKALHACGIVHADIKCDNVLVFKSHESAVNWRAKVSDFGYSVLQLEDVDDDGFLRQETPMDDRYWPPERDDFLHLRAETAKAADIWCWGMLLWQVLFDGKPYEHNGFSISKEQMTGFRQSGSVAHIARTSLEHRGREQAHRHIDAIVPQTVLDILEKALQHDATSRPTAHEILFELLEYESFKFGLRTEVRPQRVKDIDALPFFDLTHAYEPLRQFPTLAPYIFKELEAMSTTSNLNQLGEVQTQLALCAHAGFGCEKDNAKAWQLIRDASQGGSIQAKAISGRLSALIEGNIPSEQQKELLSWLSEGAGSGSWIAAEDLKRLDPTAGASPPQVETLCFGTSENTDIIEHDLIMACRSGDYNLTKHILSTFDGRIPKGKAGDTVLHWLGCFAEENVAEIASMAVSRGVNIHDRTFTDCQLSQTSHFFNKIPRGTTALYWAIQQDAHVSVRVLLEKGAISDYDSLPVEGTALSTADNPLCCAAYFHSVRSLGILCEVTGDRLVNRFDLRHRSPLLNAIDSASFNDIRHYSPRTSKPNEVALSRQVVTVNTLVAHRCDMRLVLKESFSCVHFAAMTNIDVLKTLLELPQCHSLIREPDKTGTTPLARAIQFGQIECFRLLLEKGADPSLGRVYEKMHCIHFCCLRRGKVIHQMAEELLGKFPKCVHAASLYGYTPLHVAAWNGQIEMAELLLRKGANLTSRAEYGFTPLAAAIASKSVPMVEFFLEKHKKATKALVAYRHGPYGISAFEFLLSPGRWSVRASQMGFGDFPGCLDVPFSSTSSDILGVLLDAYDANECWRLRLRRYLTYPWFWLQSPYFHNDNAWSGIRWAVCTSNSDVVEKLIKNKHFHINSKQLIGLALRQFWGDDKHHVASEADRLKMLKFIRDFRRDEFENSKHFRVDRSNMFNVFWKLYYRLCGSMAEDQHERWVSDQQKYSRENPLSLQGVGTFRFELQADSTRRIVWAYIWVGYLGTIALFVPYCVYLAKALTNPLAHSSHATKINIVICILITLLNPLWPKTIKIMSLYYNSFQSDLARKDWVLASLQVLAAICTSALWGYDFDLITSGTLSITYSGPKGTPAYHKYESACNICGGLATGLVVWLVFSQMSVHLGAAPVLLHDFLAKAESQIRLLIRSFNLSRVPSIFVVFLIAGRYRRWTRTAAFQVFIRKEIVRADGKTIFWSAT